MWFEPTLQVQELVIYKAGNEAYRAQFHSGINIISGENSSGKSTILSLLVYALGADISSWSEHAKLCDRVSVQVTLNGAVVTLSRQISEQSVQPMEIFNGPLSEGEESPTADWLRFPYKTSQGKESFSQALFRILNMPELETDASGKLTMHQVLRLLYSDQLSTVEHIFRDDNFDTPALRDAVGRLLFGAYESEIYANQLKIRGIEKELSETDAALKSIYTILSGTGHSLTLEWVKQERANLVASISELDDKIVAAESTAYDPDRQAISLDPQRIAFEKLQEVQNRLSSLDRNTENLKLETADSEIFILNTERKISSLQNSAAVAEEIPEVKYTTCPSCFAPIQSYEHEHSCHLCKQPFDDERIHKRIVHQLNDAVMQLKQSRLLQKDRIEELERIQSLRVAAVDEWDSARREYERVRQSPSTVAKDALRKLNERRGYLARELEGVDEKSALISRLEKMSRDKAELTAELARLRELNERLKVSEQDRLSRAYTAVADETVYFLHRDLPRQDSFQNAKSVSFSFAKDKISVDGQSYFSASSTVYMKNSFLSAFLFCAARDSKFRHLRFLVLDTIEDKGMEPERSQNFQRLLVDRSDSIEADHQVIFATAIINPELNTSDYVVGEASTHDNRTLNILS